MKRRVTLSALALALSAACVAPMDPGTWPPTGSTVSSLYGTPAIANSTAAQPTQDGQYPIFNWDGGIVDSREPGEIVEAEPTHDIEPSTGGGRMYILELYQAAIDERDALQLEIAALDRALERTQTELANQSRTVRERTAELEEVAAERDQLRAENEDLTARLVTAQIRRLEAEKLLIESKLEWYRGSTPTVEVVASPTPAADDSTGAAEPVGTPSTPPATGQDG